jgi:hypothetical protein
MPAISFSVFKSKIQDGSKTQTIRKPWKRPIKVGDRLYLYWKQRTAECELLLYTNCVDVTPVTIKDLGFVAGETKKDWDMTNDEFAHADGFDDWAALVDWFDKTHGLPFEGIVISWENRP